MISNSVGRELAGLVQDLLGSPDLPDVVHQRGESEFPQQPSLDPYRARLSHRQDRRVHHVRERVVVVGLHRRQRDERCPVLRDRIGEAFHGLHGKAGVGPPFLFGHLHERLGRDGRLAVQLPDRLDVALYPVGLLLVGDASDPNVREPLGRVRRRRARLRLRRQGGYRAGERVQLARGHAAIHHDALDAVYRQPSDEIAHRRARLRQGRVGDDELAADDSDRDRRRAGVQLAERLEQRVQVLSDERMTGRVEQAPARGRRQPPDQIVVERGTVGHFCKRASSARAAFRALRGPIDAARRSASSAFGVPIRRSASAAAG